MTKRNVNWNFRHRRVSFHEENSNRRFSIQNQLVVLQSRLAIDRLTFFTGERFFFFVFAAAFSSSTGKSSSE